MSLGGGHTEKKKSMAKSQSHEQNQDQFNNNGEQVDDNQSYASSPSCKSFAESYSKRTESIAGDELDDGTRGMRHGYGI